MNSNFGNNWLDRIPPVTRHLIIINVIIWLVEILIPSFGRTLINLLALHFFESPKFNPVQLITYMFLHDNTSFFHIFFNMFTLYMFGRVLEQVWGSYRFMIFYFVCGIGAAVVQEAVWALTWIHDYAAAIAPQNGLTYEHMLQYINKGIANHASDVMAGVSQYKNALVTLGASGAIFGLLLGFAFVFPNMPLYIFFIPVPIKAKYMVLGYGVIEFFLGISGGGTIAHFAHLGGMLFGLIILLWWRKKGTLHGNGFY